MTLRQNSCSSVIGGAAIETNVAVAADELHELIEKYETAYEMLPDGEVRTTVQHNLVELREKLKR